MPDAVEIKLSQLAAQSAASAAAGAALWTLPTAIGGLFLEYTGPNSLRVLSGAAYIPGLGTLLDVPNTINKTGLSLAASTHYHAYLYRNGAAPDIEIATTVPAIYRGRSRIKAGDPTRRYVGTFITSASSQIFNFYHDDEGVMYWEKQDGAPFRVLPNGKQTTDTAVSCAACVPITSHHAIVRLINLSNTVMVTGMSDGSKAWSALSPNEKSFPKHPLNANQELTYRFTSNVTNTDGGYIDVYGYALER